MTEQSPPENPANLPQSPVPRLLLASQGSWGPKSSELLSVLEKVSVDYSKNAAGVTIITIVHLC